MGRNNRLTQIAGSLRAQGHEADSILAQLLVHPDREGLPEAEVRQIARSIGAKPAGTPRPTREATSNLAPINEFCRHRAMTPEGLARVGAVAHAKLEGFGKHPYERVIEFPLRRGDLIVSSSIRRSNNSPVFRDVKSVSRPGAKRTGVFRTDFASEATHATPVLVAEGETCAASLASYHTGEVIGTPGAKPAKGALEEIARLTTGRAVVLFPDANEERPGCWLEAIATTCQRARAASIRFVPHIGDGAVKDVEDRLRLLAPDERAAWLAARVAEALAWAPAPTETPGVEQSKPTIEIDLRNPERNLAAAYEALAEDEMIFARDGRVVAAAPVAGPGETPRLVARQLKRDTLLRELSKRRTWGVWRAIKGEAAFEPKLPPEWIIRHIASSNEHPGLRPLVGIVHAPTIRKDGSIVQTPGYDAETGLLLDFAPGTFPRVPDAPTRDDAQDAADYLLKIVEQFPFATEADHDAWVALVLTLMARHILPTVPAWLVDSTTRGAGKSLLVALASQIATGRVAPVTALPEDETEGRKVVTSLVMQGTGLVAFDNARAGSTVGGSWLDALLTSESWRDRRLGSNEVFEARHGLVVCITGNNLGIGGDLARRALMIRLTPNEERPEERQDFRYPRLLAHVATIRPPLVAAALTILRAHAVAGRPTMDLGAFGSFEAWSDIVRAALVWAGLNDPLETTKALRARDGQSESIARLLECWPLLAPQGEPLTSRQIIERCRLAPDASDALGEIVPRRRQQDEPTAFHVSKALTAISGRWVGPHRLMRGDDRRRFTRFWRESRTPEAIPSTGQTPMVPMVCRWSNSQPSAGSRPLCDSRLGAPADGADGFSNPYARGESHHPIHSRTARAHTRV